MTHCPDCYTRLKRREGGNESVHVIDNYCPNCTDTEPTDTDNTFNQ